MKKKTILLLMALMVVGGIRAGKTTPAGQLLERLQRLQKKGYMYGHQDDPFYGISWEWDEGRSDTKELVGDYPAVMGFDLGGIEKGDAKNLDGVPFDRMRREIVAHHERGGIVTISWHPRNPLLGSTAWIQKDTTDYDEAVVALKKVGMAGLLAQVPNPRKTVASVLPGGTKHEVYVDWLRRVADFLATLKDAQGEPVPVIFRPFHENNGSWFWWGQSLCSDEEFHALWNMTQDYIREVLPTSIVWSYSPNLQGNWTEEAWMKRYPGDDRVDLIGEDAYQWGTEEDFVKALTADLALIAKIGKEHGKLIALTECGYQNSPDATWWTRVFRPIVERYPVSYFLPWRNYKKEHFGAAKETATAEDFKAWAKTKKFLFNNDIKNVK